jgi:hypothetical protein
MYRRFGYGPAVLWGRLATCAGLATPLAGYRDCARSQAGRARENRAETLSRRQATGWYIWCRETLLDAPGFFHPLWVDHLVERLPAAANLLGLPPGYRFLLADAYEEVWFDENLLNV